MPKWLSIPLCLFALLSGFALAQNIAEGTANAPRPVKLVPPPPPGPVYIHCGALFDGKSNQLEPNVVIALLAVWPATSRAASSNRTGRRGPGPAPRDLGALASTGRRINSSTLSWCRADTSSTSNRARRLPSLPRWIGSKGLDQERARAAFFPRIRIARWGSFGGIVAITPLGPPVSPKAWLATAIPSPGTP